MDWYEVQHKKIVQNISNFGISARSYIREKKQKKESIENSNDVKYLLSRLHCNIEMDWIEMNGNERRMEEIKCEKWFQAMNMNNLTCVIQWLQCGAVFRAGSCVVVQ